jgi:SAM-dependent methyltransferase
MNNRSYEEGFMTVHNVEQFEAWNGAEGRAWADGAVGGAKDIEAELPRRLLDAAGIGQRDHLLDIGCGTGDSALMAASRAPDGRVLGIDLSGPMLERARRAAAAAGLRHVEFVQADAQVHPLPEGTFDAAVSHYGIMFFGDPVAAFANIGRALRPGGRLAFVCPQPPETCAWYVVPIGGLLGMAPQSRPEDVVAAYPGAAPAMFSLSEPGRVREVLGQAGYSDVSVDATHVPHRFGWTAGEGADALLAHGPGRYIVEQDDDLPWDEARDRLVTALQPYTGANGVLLPGAQWLVTAHWPGSA